MQNFHAKKFQATIRKSIPLSLKDKVEFLTKV